MTTRFSLDTIGWHVPRITFGPARVAPFGGASARSPMAAPERTEKVENSRSNRSTTDRDERRQGTRESRRAGRRPDRKAIRQRLDHAARRQGRHRADSGDLHRVDQPRLGARRRRPAPRPRHRDLRTGVVGQDDAGAADDRAGAEARRRRGVHRRRARARRAVRAEARRRPRQPARLAARQRRTGARDRRSAHPLQRRRRRRRRLGGRARAARGNRRRDGRSADGPAGAADVAGAAQAHRRRLEVEDVPHLHQSAAREDRRDVRQSGNDHRRPRAEVLLVGPRRHPPHRRDQGRRDRWSAAARA